MKFGYVKHKFLLHVTQVAKLSLQAAESKAVIELPLCGFHLLYRLPSYLG